MFEICVQLVPHAAKFPVSHVPASFTPNHGMKVQRVKGVLFEKPTYLPNPDTCALSLETDHA